MDRTIAYGPADLLIFSSETSRHVNSKGMKVEDLCAAAVQHSDNTAANLLLAAQGGPRGWTDYARGLGDPDSHLDRTELSLNTPVPGQDLDTTTPAACARDLRKILLGPALSDESRKRLTHWLMTNETGANRLKAGLPQSWRIADKTGSGDDCATNDIGLLYPPTGAPIVIAAYVSGSKRPRAESEAVLAEIARIVTHESKSDASKP